MSKFTNLAFLRKVIGNLQSVDRGKHVPIDVLHEYIMRETVILWDESRGLFWVKHPDGSPQIAVWLIDAALHFDHTIWVQTNDDTKIEEDSNSQD